MSARTVVKLGGSTARGATLDRWLAAIAQASAPTVVVPGGGPFADQVRATQHALGFSDRAAHAMAILAMEQFAEIILDRGGRFVAAATPAQLETALAAGRIAVWLPSAMALAAPAIPVSWDVTADLLGAWLAGRVGAEDLLLIKQSAAIAADADVAALARRGLVDACLPAMLPRRTRLRLAGPQHLGEAGRIFAAGGLPGVAVAAAEPGRRPAEAAAVRG